MGKHAKKICSGDWNKEGLLSKIIIIILLFYIYNSYWRGGQDLDGVQPQLWHAIRLGKREVWA